MSKYLKYTLLFIFSVLLLLPLCWSSPEREETSPPTVESSPSPASSTLLPVTATLTPPTATPRYPLPDLDRIRGVWVQAYDLTNPTAVDRMLDRAERGGFNTLYVNVYLKGSTLYDSHFTAKYAPIKEDFNPLAYLVPEAHQRDLQVHAWYVVGSVGTEPPSPLVEHPEWELLGPDGKSSGWLNFTRLDVRQFLSDLMMESVTRYGVDGLHLDYTRYPGPEYGFDPYTKTEFGEATGVDLDQLRYGELPAYGTFKGNPLIVPSTAEVLATFDDGLPAVTLNSYGAGKALLLNWDATRRTIALGGVLLKNSLPVLQEDPKDLYLLNSATNAVKYGTRDFNRARDWLADLSLSSQPVTEAEIPVLSGGSVLILPNVYLISAQTARDLADFMKRGGGLIFLDGPTPSIHHADLRAVTGMRFRGRYFEKEALILPAADHPLLPCSDRGRNIEEYRSYDQVWKEFRKQGINALIRDLYHRAKAANPELLVSVTVSDDQFSTANEVLQDWPTWLSERTTDQLIPRFYVDQHAELTPLFEDWTEALGENGRTTIGLIVYSGGDTIKQPKPSSQLAEEIRSAWEKGSRGILIFDLDNMSEEQLTTVSQIFDD